MNNKSGKQTPSSTGSGDDGPVTSREMKQHVKGILDKLTAINTRLDGAFEEIRKLREEVVEKDEEIKTLNKKVELLEQWSRINNIEVSNFPITKNKNLVEVAKSLGRAVNMEVGDKDIQAVHRVPRYDRKGKNIVVQFVSRWTKNLLLQACAAYRKDNNNTISAKAVNKVLSDVPVYVSELLSPKTKLLFRKTKDKVKQIGWKYAHTREGAIYVRKNDEDKKKVHISDEADLMKLA